MPAKLIWGSDYLSFKLEIVKNNILKFSTTEAGKNYTHTKKLFSKEDRRCNGLIPATARTQHRRKKTLFTIQKLISNHVGPCHRVMSDLVPLVCMAKVGDGKDYT